MGLPPFWLALDEKKRIQIGFFVVRTRNFLPSCRKEKPKQIESTRQARTLLNCFIFLYEIRKANQEGYRMVNQLGKACKKKGMLA